MQDEMNAKEKATVVLLGVVIVLLVAVCAVVVVLEKKTFSSGGSIQTATEATTEAKPYLYKSADDYEAVEIEGISF